MKTKNQRLQQILLAAGLALGGQAHAIDLPAADGAPGMAPPFVHGGPDAAPDGRTWRAATEGHAGHAGHAGQEGRECGPGMPPGFAPATHPAAHGMGPHGPQGMSPPAGAEPPFLRGLDLSEAQQDKVFAILHGQTAYLREQDKAVRKAHEALRTLAQSTQYDDAKAAALAQSGAQAMANIALQHARTEQKLLALLSVEQRKQVAERKPQQPPRP